MVFVGLFLKFFLILGFMNMLVLRMNFMFIIILFKVFFFKNLGDLMKVGFVFGVSEFVSFEVFREEVVNFVRVFE